ncbi:MAG: TIM barrel protein [Chloroflexi bacterium]|nr:TIM barrel protein [Chloroflexota bacterium]
MSIAQAPVGIVPINFANDDLPELTPPMDPELLVSEMARLGFTGCQLSRALPARKALQPTLQRFGMRIAEVYAALPCTSSGPEAAARDQAFDRLEELRRCDGDVLVFSYHLSPERVGWAGRANQADTPSLTSEGRERALALLDEVARAADARGKAVVYHPHVGSFVETPAEVDWLMASTDSRLVGLCLDVGHYTVGGGDPVDAIRRYGSRLRHVHLKDVDPTVLQAMRNGAIPDFLEALRRRIFTELGSGMLDVLGVVRELGRLDYRGWIMCEQDTTWRPPAESSAISRAVLAYCARLAQA